MRTNLATATASTHLLRSETRPTMAKADLRKADIEPWRVEIGRAIDRARLLRGWSLKELADAVGRDERQVSRWIAGTERPQMDALFAVVSLRCALVQAFAELAGSDVEVTTHITVRRTA